MQKKHHVFLYGFLSLALVLAMVYAGQQASLAKRMEGSLEDMYISALTQSVSTLESMGVKMEKLLISADPAQEAVLLSQLSRQAGEVQQNLTLLPLSHSAIGPTVRFANQLSDYTLSLASQLQTKSGIPDQDADTLSSLRAQLSQLGSQLFLAQKEMESAGLSLVSLEPAFYENAQADVRPLEQLGDKDSGMDYPTLIYDGAFSDGRHLGTPKGLPQEQIAADDAIEIAKQFVGAERVTGAEAAASVTGTIPAWGVKIDTPDCQLTVEVTRQGGKVLWMVPEHAEFTPLISLEECRQKAADFLASRGFGPMEAHYYQAYEGLAVINFAALQDDVLLYPDLVKVQVRLDTGEVVGLEANNYWMNHIRRELPAPAVSLAQAQTRLSSRLDVKSSRLCLIPYLGTERLCYEFAGYWDDNEYRVYIDAVTGEEAEILKVIPMENGILAA